MFIPSPDRAKVRKLLDRIPTDSDFDAFCLDFFPEVQARFAAGMDRVQKTTLLLQLESDCQYIAEKLRQRFANLTTVTPGRTNIRRPYTLLWVVGGAMLVAAVLLVYRLSGNSRVRIVAPTPISLPIPPLMSQTLRPPPPNPPPARRRLTVEQEGDIHAKGSVSITVPSGSQEATIKTHGQIASGGDVNIGVTTSVPSSSAPQKKDAQP